MVFSIEVEWKDCLGVLGDVGKGYVLMDHSVDPIGGCVITIEGIRSVQSPTQEAGGSLVETTVGGVERSSDPTSNTPD